MAAPATSVSTRRRARARVTVRHNERRASRTIRPRAAPATITTGSRYRGADRVGRRSPTLLRWRTTFGTSGASGKGRHRDAGDRRPRQGVQGRDDAAPGWRRRRWRRGVWRRRRRSSSRRHRGRRCRGPGRSWHRVWTSRRTEVVADVQTLAGQGVVGDAPGGDRGRRRWRRHLLGRGCVAGRPVGSGLAERATVGDIADRCAQHEQRGQDRHATGLPPLGELVSPVDGVGRAGDQAGQQRCPRHDERRALSVHQ